MTKITESEYDAVCGNIIKKLMFVKITHPQQASGGLMYIELVWSCVAIQDSNSKTKTVT